MLLHVVVPVLGIVVFAFPLYAQYFDLNKLFSYVLAYPFNWGGIAAVVWVVAGIVVTLVMMRVKSGGARGGHARLRWGRRRGGRLSSHDDLEPRI